MKIGLIFPNKDRKYKTIHLGLAYLAAYEREKHEDLFFEVLDTRVATRKETGRFFNTSFDLIGITVFTPVYFEVKNIFNRIKLKERNIPVVLGGPYVTPIMGDIFKETPAEYAIYGEGEVTFYQLISHIKGQLEIEDIDGLMYKNDRGDIIINPAREKIKDLNTLPFPAYDIFPMNRYPLHRLVTSRGCWFLCAWCNSSSIWDNSYRSLYAIKKKCYTEIPDRIILDDLYLTLKILRSNQVRFLKECQIFDEHASLIYNYQRTKRYLQGFLQLITEKDLISQLKTKQILMFFWHKYFRLFIPVLLFLMYISFGITCIGSFENTVVFLIITAFAIISILPGTVKIRSSLMKFIQINFLYFIALAELFFVSFIYKKLISNLTK